MITKVPNKSKFDKNSNKPSIIRNTTHVDFNYKKLDKVRFVKLNNMPAGGEHLTAKNYVDYVIYRRVHESSLLRLDPNKKMKLDEQDSLVLQSTLTSPKTIIELPTKPYVDNSHETNRNRRDLSSVFNDQDNEVDNIKSTILDCVTVNRDPI